MRRGIFTFGSRRLRTRIGPVRCPGYADRGLFSAGPVNCGRAAWRKRKGGQRRELPPGLAGKGAPPGEGRKLSWRPEKGGQARWSPSCPPVYSSSARKRASASSSPEAMADAVSWRRAAISSMCLRVGMRWEGLSV